MRKLWRLGGRAAVVLIVVVATSFVSATAAQAYELVGYLQNHQTKACLDSNKAGDVYTLECQYGNGYQTWRIQGPVGRSHDGYEQVRIINKATGLCLKMFLSPGNNNSMSVKTSYCVNVKNEGVFDGRGPNWQNVQLRGLHYWTFGRQLCVDSVRAGMAYANICNWGTYQTWRLSVLPESKW
ncbi:RICIN domain-containing protein [Dactylosporangium sp. CA-152071]|uniref:RICIN domain-containing protein n=1 Tax=Dactylosporangium sp. CA-152071 TaxID=3239933 RepID=UPI003D8EEE69